ncbi:right-handed parallel beta-helix repeat-containing protein [bacterium]|nr:right-handed parallel beta-helix repeat-containing protein [bacterium]
MDGSLYPDGVLIDRTALRRTETTKAEQIVRLRTDVTSRGVYSGGSVTVNGANVDRIDIGAFTGYTPRGDYIVETGSNTNIALSDYAAGTINVVCAVYTEDETHNQPHETDGSTYPTYAEGTYRIRVFSQADFDNPAVLTPTDDNLDNDAKDRCLVLAQVRAEGALAAIVSITETTAHNEVLYTNPVTLSAITGVTILSVDPDCPTGIGTIRFDDSAAPTYKFYWTSPGGTISTVENVTSDSIVTITDNTAPTGYWIKLQIIISQLPTSLIVAPATYYDESITVTNLYYQELPRLTGEDDYHRNLLGTGIVTAHNPHGTSLDDLAGEDLPQLEEHQDIQHDNGIWEGSSAAIFLGSVSTASPSGDTLSVQAPPAGSIYYVNGKKLDDMSPASIIFNATNFTGGYLGTTAKEGAKLYEIYVDDSEVLTPHLRATYPAVRQTTGTWMLDISPDHPAGSYDLSLVMSDVGGASASFTVSWGTGPTYTGDLPSISGLSGQAVKLYLPDGVNWATFWVGDENVLGGDQYLPGANGTYVSTLTTLASLDRDQNMQIISLSYWYDPLVLRGSIGYPPYGGTRAWQDKRTFGTLGVGQITDTALDTMVYKPLDEYQKSGIVQRRNSQSDFLLGTPSGLTIELIGGVMYCRGERIAFEGGDQAFTDNQISIVWVDYLGTIHIDDYASSPFSSNLQRSLAWLQGYPADRDPTLDSDFPGDEKLVPERGVPLYLVTAAAGSIDATYGIVDISRSVGEFVENNTVGKRTECIAEFDNFQTAFARASVDALSSMAGKSGTTLKVVGDVLLAEVVTQPSHVKVIGGSVINSNPLVTVDMQTPVATGAWILSEGCIVEGVDILVVASSATACFRLDDHVVIDRCHFEGDADAWFASMASNADGATIKNCHFMANDGLFNDSGGDFYRMRFLDNYVESDDYQSSTIAMVETSNWHQAEVVGNTFIKNNSNSAETSAFKSTGSDSLNISRNQVFIRSGNIAFTTLLNIGIEVVSCDNCIIVENDIQPYSGDSLYKGCGIKVNTSSTVNISNNNIQLLLCGIHVGGKFLVENGYFENTIISNNQMAACYSRGVFVGADMRGSLANTLIGLTISDNQITATNRLENSIDYYSGAKGIEVLIKESILDTIYYVRDLVVKNNIVDFVWNSETISHPGDALGVDVWVDIGDAITNQVDNISVDSNNISRIATLSANDVYAIRVTTDSAAGPYLGQILNTSICNNSIELNTSSVVTALHGVHFSCDTGSALIPQIYGASIDNNNIIISATNGTWQGDGIVLVNDNGLTNSSISNNSIYAPWDGIIAGGEGFKISGNSIQAGSTGIYCSKLGTYLNLRSSIDNNNIIVFAANANRYMAIQGTDFGCMGILIGVDSVFFDLTANKVELIGTAMPRQSASICLPGTNSGAAVDGSGNFVIDGCNSVHAYASMAAGSDDPNCYHIYVFRPESGWVISNCVIDNDGTGGALPTPSPSHGIYLNAGSVGLTSTYRGCIRGNTIMGSNDGITSTTSYEIFLGVYGAIANTGHTTLTGNHISLKISAGGSPAGSAYPRTSIDGAPIAPPGLPQVPSPSSTQSAFSPGTNSYDYWLTGNFGLGTF